MPEIGSCISLISKADIRYEGLLFTVDPDRCTIALARVKSYGTEDRETQFPIAPQNQCYDYILFRGSDIKDIRVINNNPVPNDPAIMQMHLPPQQPLPPMQNKLGQPGFQPQPGFMMPPIGPGGPGPMGGPPPGHQPIGQPYSSFGGINNLGDLISGSGAGGAGGGAVTSGSRSTTPSNLLSRKSPTVDMGVQTNQQQQGAGQQQQNNRDGNRSGGDGGNMQMRNRNNSQRSQGGGGGQQQQRERRDSGKVDGQMKDNYNKNMQRQGNGNQNRGWHNNRGNNQNMGNNMRGGRPRGRGGLPQGINRAKNLLKFENDYDFEQANSKFEELRSQLSKLKVGDDAKPEQLNTEQLDKQKDDSGNETGAGEHEQEEDDLVCYDKAKSFFDNISCEAIERAKGKQQRTDWRQERKLNTETFGVGSTRRGGYNHRRGGYYNRGPHNYRNNNQYRGGNNYRGRSNNRLNQPNGLPHNTNRLNTNQQQQQQAQQQQASQQQQQQPAIIEVAAGK